jgi:hypothetical protein
MNKLKLTAAIVVILIAVTGFSPTASAQGFGVKGGVLFPDFSAEGVDLDNKVGTELGFFFGGNRSGILGFQGEANWLRKQADFTGGDFRIDYIQLAGLLRLNAGTKSPSGFALYGLVGPGFDFKIADSTSGLNVDDAFRGFDIGLLFGGGVEIKRFIVEGRYSRGLRQVNEDFTGATELKSHSFAILVGFRIK